MSFGNSFDDFPENQLNKFSTDKKSKDNIIRRFATDCNLWGFGVEMMHFGAFIREIIVPDFSVPVSRKSFWGLTL